MSAIVWRIVATVLVAVVSFWVRSLYTFATADALIDKSLGQMNGTVSPYDPTFSANAFVINYLPVVAFLAVVVIWAPFAWRKWKASSASRMTIFALATFGSLAVGSQAQAYYADRDDDEYFLCGSNETCFQIGFTKDTMRSQAAFKSEQFYLESKVPTARFRVPHMPLPKAGALTRDMVISSAQFIIVDRAPVWRLWTSDSGTGSSAKNQGFDFESKDSINIKTAGTCTAFVQEEDAHKYLRWYGVKTAFGANRNDPAVLYATSVTALPLSEVMDTEMHGLFQATLTAEFGKEDFNTVYTKKTEINNALNAAMKAYYAPRGITIGFCSIAGSLTFEPEIQKALNDKFVSANPATVQMMAYREQNANIMLREGLAQALSTKGLPSTLVSSDLMTTFLGIKQTAAGTISTPIAPSSAR